MKKEFDKETLKRLYIKEKRSLNDIAKMFGRSYFGVRHRCIQYGIKLRPQGCRRKIHIKKSSLQRLYLKEKKSLKQIAKILSCSRGTVIKRCKEYKIQLRWQRVEGLTKSKLETLYIKEGKTVREIARMLGCSYEPLRKRCKEFGVSLRNPGYKKLQIDELTLGMLYVKKGKRMSEIAKIYNCSVASISKRVKEFGLKKKDD